MAIEFNNDVQKKVYGNLNKWGREIYGEMFTSNSNYAEFSVSFGSARVYIFVRPFGDSECTIHFWTSLIDEVDISTDLLEYLLIENNSLPFGGFGIGETDDSGEYIILEENIVGSSTTKDELRLTIGLLGRMADHYDDEIKNKWGGRRSIEF